MNTPNQQKMATLNKIQSEIDYTKQVIDFLKHRNASIGITMRKGRKPISILLDDMGRYCPKCDTQNQQLSITIKNKPLQALILAMENHLIQLQEDFDKV